MYMPSSVELCFDTVEDTTVTQEENGSCYGWGKMGALATLEGGLDTNEVCSRDFCSVIIPLPFS